MRKVEEDAMASGLISLLILILILGLVLWLCIYLIDMLPMPPPFGQVAKVVLILIAIIILLSKALPLAGVSM